MKEIQSLRFRRYVLRSRRNGRPVSIIEADSMTQAQDRAQLLQDTSKLFSNDGELVAERADLPMQLPTFLNSYFAMLKK